MIATRPPLSTVVRVSERPGEEPWEQRWRGLTWRDMPTRGGYENQLLDFALFRRGMYQPEIDLMVEEVTEEEPAPGQVKVKQRKSSFGQIRSIGIGRARNAAAADLVDKDLRTVRQAEILARYQELKKTHGFVCAMKRHQPTAFSAINRAMGKGRAVKGVLRTESLDGIERAFESLTKNPTRA